MVALDVRQGARAPAEAGAPSLKAQLWVLLLIFLLMACNYVDRTIIRILAQPISREFGLTDFQVGLLSGLAFAILYVLLAVPISVWSERRNRVRIISGAIAIWSVMTMLCGAAASYAQLFLARVGVGIGEAGAAPTSHSLIADYFPPERRASAISVHSFGIAVGAILGSVIGGFVAERWGWRSALLVVGLPGLLLAGLMLTVREPARGTFDRGAKRLTTGLGPTAKLLFTNRTFLHLAIGSGVLNLAVNGLHTFESLYFIRTYHLSLGEAGAVVGLTSGVSTAIGMLAGGFLVDRLVRGDPRWYAWLPALGVALAAPLYASVFMQSTWLPAAFLLATPGLFLFLYVAPVHAVIHNICHAHMRATAVALYMLITAGLGVALGPVITGYLADRFASASFHGAGSYASVCGGASPIQQCRDASAAGLQAALIAVCVLLVWGAAHFLLAARSVRADIGRPLGMEAA
jgi:predicted MFS family arabinose efflux permease